MFGAASRRKRRGAPQTFSGCRRGVKMRLHPRPAAQARHSSTGAAGARPWNKINMDRNKKEIKKNKKKKSTNPLSDIDDCATGGLIWMFGVTAAQRRDWLRPERSGSSYLSTTPMADNSISSFKAADLVIQLSSTPKTKLDVFSFGTVFTDHMLTIEWSAAGGWQAPLIRPFGNLSLNPACSSLHYGIQLFEGLKVYRGDDNRLRLFRPMLNMNRMANSAKRACLPAFDQSELLECIRRLVEIDQDWVPHSDPASLYIRPTFISTEPSLGVKKPSSALLYVILSQAGSYFNNEAKDISLWADPKYTRAWKGGTGDCKMGGNYGCALFAQYEAVDYGCQQVLWLYGEDHQITEAGTMNVFLHWINEDGEEELATPPLDGIILPGITRQSILDLTKKWGEFKVTERYLTMSQLRSALKQQRVKEMFGSGTACMICPIGSIIYQGESLHIPCQDKNSQLTSQIAKELTDIQYGRTPSDWTLLV